MAGPIGGTLGEIMGDRLGGAVGGAVGSTMQTLPPFQLGYGPTMAPPDAFEPQQGPDGQLYLPGLPGPVTAEEYLDPGDVEVEIDSITCQALFTSFQQRVQYLARTVPLSSMPDAVLEPLAPPR